MKNSTFNQSILIFLLIGTSAFGQGLLKNAKYIEVGGLVGFGQTMDRQSVPEGAYNPYTFVGHFSMDLIRQEKLKGIFPGRFLLASEPQVNYVKLESTPSRNEWEFGLVTVLQYMYPIHPRLHIYALGGSGPFWISTQTVVQKQGFLFCNYFGIGVYFFPFKDEKIAINLGFRARHMSNANIWQPNNGINSHLIVIGLTRFLK